MPRCAVFSAEFIVLPTSADREPRGTAARVYEILWLEEPEPDEIG
jgi:hypothetical protein